MWEVFVYLYVQHHTFETLNFQRQIVSREWEAGLSWNERDGSQQHWWPDVKHNHYVTVEAENTVRDRGDLRCQRFRRLV